MNFEMLVESKLVTELGWTLFHSLWQIALVSFALLIALRLLSNSSAQLRYIVCVAALAIAVTLPVVTFTQLSTQAPSSFWSEKTQTKNVPARVAETLRSGETGITDTRAITNGATATSARDIVNGLSNWLEQRLPD